MQPKYPKPDACTGCALALTGYGYAPYHGPDTTRVFFRAEALGVEEATHGQPLIGAAGGVHTRVLRRAAMDRDACGHDNCIRCRPPENWLVGAPWEAAALAHCRQAYLTQTLNRVMPNGVLVPLGLTALRQTLGLHGVPGVAIKDFHGTISRDPSDRFWVVPCYHPSHLQRGAMARFDVAARDYGIAQHIADHGFTRSPAELVVDPSPQWFAAWVTDHLARLAHDLESTWLGLDTEFLETAGGVDESELVSWDRTSPMTRVNVANRQDQGVTVPYREPYIVEVERLLAGVCAARGWVFLWNKYADLDHLGNAGHTLDGMVAIDLMWAMHYLQPSLPRGLGFWAALASDFGPWKHWAKQSGKEGPYGAADGLQTYRTAVWGVTQLIQAGLWTVFFRDHHERDQYVLRPARLGGVPIDRPELEAFHQELQRKLANILVRIKTTAAAGVRKPKLGYGRKPRGTPCEVCKGKRKIRTPGLTKAGKLKSILVTCDACQGVGHDDRPSPPKSIIGKPTRGGGEAKTQYLTEGVELVQAEVELETWSCTACEADNVRMQHTCDGEPTRHDAASGVPDQKGQAHRETISGQRSDVGAAPLRGNLVQRHLSVTRWFWQLPFNPDAPQQILAYLASQGESAPLARKTRKPTTDKDAMKALAKKYGEADPFYQYVLDWKAVQKVDSTYVIGVLSRLDDDDRLHPEIAPKPQTLRDSCTGPNLQNVVADRDGPASLAAGFRRVVVSRDGVPADRTEEEREAWEMKWGGAA